MSHRFKAVPLTCNVESAPKTLLIQAEIGLSRSLRASGITYCHQVLGRVAPCLELDHEFSETVRCLDSRKRSKFDVSISQKRNNTSSISQTIPFSICVYKFRVLNLKPSFSLHSCRLPVDCLSGCNISRSIFPVLLCVRRGSPVVSAWGCDTRGAGFEPSLSFLFLLQISRGPSEKGAEGVPRGFGGKKWKK